MSYHNGNLLQVIFGSELLDLSAELFVWKFDQHNPTLPAYIKQQSH